MSQNRQSDIDRAAAENDYQVNLKSELEIADLHRRIEHLTKLVEAHTQLTEDIVKKLDGNN